MRRPALDKVVFAASLVVLSFLYGYATQRFDLFLNPHLERAVRQALVAGSATDSELPAYTSPRIYDWKGVRAAEPGAVQPGLTLISSVWEGETWMPGLKLVDDRGTVVHEWQVDPSEVFSGSGGLRRTLSHAEERSVHGSVLLESGDVLMNVDYVGTVRLDACGRVLWKLDEGNHHSIELAEDGSFWIPGVSEEPRRASPAHPDGFPGIDTPVFQDRILRVGRDGEVVTRINVLDVLYENGLERYIPKSRNGHGTDVVHLNDVEPLKESMANEYPLFEAGDLLVSLRNLDLVFVFDPKTWEVKWHESEPFIQQHDPDFVGDGWIGVFDNNVDGTPRGTMLGGSRIVFLQPHSDSTRIPFPSSQSDPLYTHVQGKWQQLANGNMLLTEAQAGRIAEVAPDGRTVWEWAAAPYDETLVPEVAKGARYGVTADEATSWPCSATSSSDTGEETAP